MKIAIRIILKSPRWGNHWFEVAPSLLRNFDSSAGNLTPLQFEDSFLYHLSFLASSSMRFIFREKLKAKNWVIINQLALGLPHPLPLESKMNAQAIDGVMAWVPEPSSNWIRKDEFFLPSPGMAREVFFLSRAKRYRDDMPKCGRKNLPLGACHNHPVLVRSKATVFSMSSKHFQHTSLSPQT